MMIIYLSGIYTNWSQITNLLTKMTKDQQKVNCQKLKILKGRERERENIKIEKGTSNLYVWLMGPWDY